MGYGVQLKAPGELSDTGETNRIKFLFLNLYYHLSAMLSNGNLQSAILTLSLIDLFFDNPYNQIFLYF